MRRNPLLVPLLVIAALAVIGFLGNRYADRSLKGRAEEELVTILEADLEGLLLWLDSHRATASYVAEDPEIRQDLLALINYSRGDVTPADLVAHPSARTLRVRLVPALEAFDYLSYYVGDRTGTSLASTFDEFVGMAPPAEIVPYIQVLNSGETGVTRPLVLAAGPTFIPGNEQYNQRVGLPIMFVGAPVFGDDGAVVGQLAFGIAPEVDFTRILSVARLGESGETYAFDSSGTMLSRSRFDAELAGVGLLTGDSYQTSVLNVELRDPGGNLLKGFPLPVNLRTLPLTTMAADAVNHRYVPGSDNPDFGINVDGYRDYRGVMVVGAWTWLPEYGFGVAAEVDVAEAFAARTIVRRVLITLVCLLLGGALIALLINWKLQCRMTAAEQVGQYKLEKKIGEGGMGQVYRARHQLLRRSTAVKLLRPDRTNPETVRRFEREVRHTSKLTHPNTVAIYDYGRTPDGVFYYAMEHLPGVTIQQLIEGHGALPQARVLHILRQVAGSLAEAHGKGLIHRDIKPSNIMLGERGGIFDFVKVLDFGLVKQADQSETLAMTSPDAMTGTPLYISPEAIKDATSVDGRTDLYALGAVAYLMLTGDHVFQAKNLAEIVSHHLHTVPEPPSTRLGTALHPEVDNLVLSLLSKDPADRVPSAGILHNLLESLCEEIPWTPTAAARWWTEHATQRESKGTWHVDFASSDPTPESGSQLSEAGLVVVDAGRRDATTPSAFLDTA